MIFLRRFAIFAVVLVATASAARACPFCSAVTLTFSEEMKQADVAVIAKLVERGEVAFDSNVREVPDGSDSTFEVVEVLKGSSVLGDKEKLKAAKFKTVYFGKDSVGTRFLVMASEPPVLKWATPIKLTDRAVNYVKQSSKLPADGVERLAFFQEYLNDKNTLLAQDAYDEFAKADYKVVQALKPHMDREQLLAWVQDTKIPASRRRLFLTMLGVCGEKQDIAVLEKMLKSDDTATKDGLDALIASYLTLKGADGMELIEDLFIKNEKAPFTETYKAIMALRFLGEDQSVIPRKRILVALRLMLARPKYADLVIPDLARWEDWEAMPQLVKLFEEATQDNSWVRVPVLRYLKACPLPEAEAHVAALSKLDPVAAKRAASFFPLPGAKQPTEKTEKKDAAKTGVPADKAETPKTTSQTAAPTATNQNTANQDAVRRVNKPVIATPSAKLTKSGEEVALLPPFTDSRQAESASLSAFTLLLAFGGSALLLALLMYSLLFGSARYEKIAKHGVRRK